MCTEIRFNRGPGLGLGPHGGDAPEMVSGLIRPECEREKQEDSSPWRLLPSDILERALALLPLPDVFRVRAVCKRWNALIHCSQFQEMCLTSRGAWGPFYTPRVGWKGRGSPVVPWSSYDLAERKWITMPELPFPSQAGHHSWNLLAADGGLLCFGASHGRGILVCNPMTNRWKELPFVSSAGTRAPVISHMIVDEQRSSYKILFAGHATYKQPDFNFTTNCNPVDLYDSISKTWKAAETMSADMQLRSGAYCKDEFYILTRHLRTGVHAMVALDLTTLAWRDFSIPVPEILAYPYIVACSGKVYLVGGSTEATDRMPMASVCIFMLECSKFPRWSKVSEYCNEPFLRSTGAIYGCGASGSKIYVVTYAYDMWVAVYNCATGVWEDPCKGSFFDMKDIFETKFSFQPNLQVTP